MLLVGSGSGGLLVRSAERVGPRGRVMGVDVDPVKVESARTLVGGPGLSHVHSAAADGWYGWRENAPHDLVISTVSVRSLPPSWVTQSRPGSLICAPVQLICAPVQGDGETERVFFATFRVESRHEVSLLAAVPGRYGQLRRNWARTGEGDGAPATHDARHSADRPVVHSADIELREALLALGQRNSA
ncbi:hypothetical protein AB0I49_25655 [Streptomyces sp. NPDC050617]|uniref:hypothetical protein n=1 Tax=Streptomyces sp. NPDC050617 TaxID=3154628 RepID=UPI00341C1E6E